MRKVQQEIEIQIVYINLVIVNNDELIDVSLLLPLGKSHHSTVEILVKYSV